MQSKRGLVLEGVWLAWVGGAPSCGGGAKTESRRGPRLVEAWLIRVGGASTRVGGAKMQSRHGLVWMGRG